MMAEQTGISASAVRRIWRAYGLQPHRYRQFKLSNAPKFAQTVVEPSAMLHELVRLGRPPS
jgi:hypothetical protein